MLNFNMHPDTESSLLELLEFCCERATMTLGKAMPVKSAYWDEDLTADLENSYFVMLTEMQGAQVR